MSLYNRYAAPEPDYTEEEWDAAHTRLVDALVEDGWTETEALARVDDWAVRDQIDADRADATHEQVDRLIKLRKEEGR